MMYYSNVCTFVIETGALCLLNRCFIVQPKLLLYPLIKYRAVKRNSYVISTADICIVFFALIKTEIVLFNTYKDILAFNFV